MTPDEVRARWNSLASGERDAWVTTKLMTWSHPRYGQQRFSTDDAAAFSIIPRLGESFDLNYMPQAEPCGAWKAGVVLGRQYAEAGTAAEAICLAALMYVECELQPESHGDFKKMMHDLSDEHGKIDKEKVAKLIGDTTNTAGSGERE